MSQSSCPPRSSVCRRPFAARGLFVALGLLGVAAASVFACGGEVDPHYGPPGALEGKTPQAYDDSGAPVGTTPPVDTGTGPGPVNTLCGGKGPIDGGTCAVSWSKDIYPQMKDTGNWKCQNSGCHGPGSGTPPLISGTDATSVYNQLVSYKVTQNGMKPYFDPCTTDPTTSSVACNIGGLGTACAAMPLAAAGAKTLTPQEQQMVQTWVKCGSPNN